jgi:hypothetical protein
MQQAVQPPHWFFWTWFLTFRLLRLAISILLEQGGIADVPRTSLPRRQIRQNHRWKSLGTGHKLASINRIGLLEGRCFYAKELGQHAYIYGTCILQEAGIWRGQATDKERQHAHTMHERAALG